MSFIGANIRKIRAVRKFSQAAFAELFGLARPSVGAWEEGRSEPKTDTLILIAQHFGVSVDMLLTKELTVNDLLHFDLYQHQRHATAAAPPLHPDQQAPLTPFVRADQSLEYAMRCQDPTWIAALPLLTLPPGLSPATRAFEVGTSEMAHQPTGGLRPRDVVVGALIRPATAATALRGGQCYVIVSRNGLVMRRLVTFEGASTTLHLTADNPDYPTTTLALRDILEIWHIQVVLTPPPPPPATLDERVARLEELVARLTTG